MWRSFRLGSAFGIPLFVHWSFLVLPVWAWFVSRDAGLLGILFSQAVLFSIFACVLLHELGHALMARAFGIPTRDITLYPIGGVARLESTGRRPGEEVCIALAGPAVNLAVVLLLAPIVAAVLVGGLHADAAAALAGTGHPLGLLSAYLLAIWLGNVVLLLFNLIPAFPMDGGRVLRGLLAVPLGRVTATEVAAAVGLLAAGLMALAGLWFGHPMLVLVAVAVTVLGQQEAAVVREVEARRRFAEPVVVAPIPVEVATFPRLGRFTGLLWDADRRVWVRWVDGRPI